MLLPTLMMGGMERMVYDLALGLKCANLSVQVICTHAEGVLAAELRASGVAVSLLSVNGWRPWFGDPALVAALRTLRPDIVHTHSGFWWHGAVASRRASVPGTVHTVHGLHAKEPWWGPTEKRLAATLTDRVVAVSPALSTYLTAKCSLPARQVVTLPNGVDLARFGDAQPMPLRDQLALSPQAFVFGTVARLAPVKNLDLGITVLPKLVEQGVDAHFVLAGDGSERVRLEGVVAAAGLAPRVHFLGEVAEPNRFLAALDVFTLTSYAEGTSISLLEAMASRLPCVVTAVGGNPDVVANGEAGVLIPDNDAPALADALLMLARDAAQRSALGQLARQRVQSVYSLEAMVESYLQLYAQALQARP